MTSTATSPSANPRADLPTLQAQLATSKAKTQPLLNNLQARVDALEGHATVQDKKNKEDLKQLEENHADLISKTMERINKLEETVDELKKRLSPGDNFGMKALD
ncbi:hypothetical protein CC86DRAFT_401160 [Ophiobolus disseminans]|uniref:Uncharacterized protein n=1 Tax=Ophiobolus disseminans TaxID=1469910 RepID=A0A6A7AGX4_9PLEO|nr:hypothetical protein CC86DRAFT_401160 [Ophiobolus disseminans]